MELKQSILDATSGGKDILLSLYPDAGNVVGTKKKFKMRSDERTASAVISEREGVWYVKDFGDSDRAMNCFDAYMKETGITSFTECLYRLADEWKVDYTLKKDINKPKNKEFKDAPKGAKEGDFDYKIKLKPSKADLECFGPFVTPAILEKYHYYCLEYYTRVCVNSKTNRLISVTITSSDDYPIFLHEMGDCKKVYIPLAYEKKDRFFYVGKVDQELINGYKEAKVAYDKLRAQDYGGDDPFADNEKELPNTKLDGVYICSGERDAMNLAGMGLLPIWFNSETAHITEDLISKLRTIANNIYNIPDIDSTGIRQGNKLALDFLDIHTIELPSWLLTFRDRRGRPRKDLRDYLELRPNKNDFHRLQQTAKCCRFWKIKYSDKGAKTEISTTSLLHYLRMNGFYKLKDRITGEMHPVRIDGYKVEEYTPKQIRDFIREDLKRRQVENIAYEAYVNSKKATVSVYDDLDTIELDFKVSDPNSRTLFFDNCCVNIPMGNKDAIRITHPRDIEENAWHSWRERIIPHRFTPMPAAFHVDKDGVLYIDSDKSCCFRYLINASRIYWKKEYEDLASENPEEDKQYRDAVRFTVYGARLSNGERLEQMKHLLSKLWAIGFLMHHYKIDSRALCLWVMENKLTNEDESSGGSGKSFFMRMFHYLQLAHIVTLDGRDSDLTKNNHFLDRVSTNTDILFVDDAEKNFNFNSFYGKITGVLTVNPKGTQSFEIDYKDSPYVVISSNFPPPSSDRSSLRRLLPLVYSDYYHEQGDDGQYKETRRICDDFGYDLFDWQYKEEYYNADYNFFIDCLQFYLNNQDNVMRPPMENIIKRIQIKDMGDTFKEWAEGYYAPDNGHLDKLLYRGYVYSDYLQYAGNNKFTKNPPNFKKALYAFAKYHGYTFNPPEIRGYRPDEKRSTINVTIDGKRASYEFCYMKTPDAKINNSTEYDDPYVGTTQAEKAEPAKPADSQSVMTF